MVSNPAPRSASRVLVPAIVGVLVGAAVVGGLWLTVGSSSDDLPTASGAATDPITPPAKVGDYRFFADVPLNKEPRAQQAVRSADARDAENTKRLSAAYRGAAAVVKTYSNNDLLAFVPAYVVRASSPGLVAPYSDPKDLGLPKPEYEPMTFGDVECVAHNQPTTGGHSEVYATECQRTSANLTVHVPPVGGPIGQHPDQLAAFVGELFDAIH